MLQSCIKRIEKKGEGDCEAWYFDYYKCIDKCVSRELARLLVNAMLVNVMTLVILSD